MTNVFEELRAAVGGRVTTPEDPNWDEARKSFNLSVDQRPAVVTHAANPEDVQEVVRFAAANGLRVAPQGTGHGSESLGALDGAILLKTSDMREVTVDADNGVARAEAGALAGEVAAAAGKHGRAPVLGLATTVGVTGLALGGGTGWLSRAHGLTANNVRAFEVVTPAGERLRADAHTEPDLFWALRGGGGRFAIVTAMELETYAAPELSAGAMMWPAERAAEVLERFRDWASDAPEAAGAVFRYLDLPPIDAIPEPIRGRRIVAVIASYLGPEADQLIEPLRAMGGTIVDTFGPIEPAQLVRVAGDPDQPGPARGDGFLIEQLSDEVIAAVVELIEQNALKPLAVLELRLLGGAMARADNGNGALARLHGAYSLFAGGAVFGPEMAAANAERLAELRARFAPWTTPQALLNSSGGGIDPARAFDPPTWERLRRIRDAFDPDRLLLPNHDA